jgi:hypothetical protein
MTSSEAPVRHVKWVPKRTGRLPGPVALTLRYPVLCARLQPISSDVLEHQTTPHGPDAQRAVVSAR